LAELTNVYEAMVIFDSNRFARDRSAMPAELEKSIKTGGGEVLVSRLWEERRLAYPIAGQRRGTYWLYYFRGPSSIVSSLNREWEIHDGILRHLVLKVHPHLVEAVLEHARTGPAPQPTPTPQPTPAAVIAGGVDVDVPDLEAESEA